MHPPTINPEAARTASESLPKQVEREVGPFSRDLAEVLRKLLGLMPGGPHKPTPLAKVARMNRVTVSRLLNALKHENPYEVLQSLPGPESLRGFVKAARRLEVSTDVCDDAERLIEHFEALIRDQFGTRGALNAAISPSDESLSRRFQENSRYHIYKGMRQVLGMEAETWLTCMLFVPSDDLSMEHIAVTSIHGALGMRRLRPDVSVHFTFGPPYHAPGDDPDPAQSSISLQDLYTNAPAALDTHLSEAGQLVHRLSNDAIGKSAVVDMLAVSHDQHGSRRYATAERARGGAAVFPDVPVRMLHCDVLIPDDVFPDGNPELLVYSPGARGPANPNDPTRDIDRVNVSEQIEEVAADAERFAVDEVPNYEKIVQRVCGQIGRNVGAFRVFRLRMAYPVHGFQYVMAFKAPQRPG